MNEEQIDRIKSLLTKRIFTDLNEQETEELNKWRSLSANNNELYTNLGDKKYLTKRYLDFKEVNNQQQVNKPSRLLNIFGQKWIKWAAAIFIIGATTVSLYQVVYDRNEGSQFNSGLLTYNQNNESAITLSVNGKQTINLDEVKDNTKIFGLSAILDNHVLKYELSGPQEEKIIKKASRHQLSVPKIEMFKVILPDGSVVWLNSMSKLSYPSHFDNTSREVYLEGEGFFEISKDSSRPFFVNVNGMSIMVTGTQFNVRAYRADRKVLATLVEGIISVGYNDADGIKKEYKMKPGEQSLLDKQGKVIEVREVNTSIYSSWKDGVYFFDSQKLEDIMNDLGRWYGIEVVFKEEAIKSRILSGKLYREKSAEKMIASFSTLLPGHIITDGRTVTIY